MKRSVILIGAVCMAGLIFAADVHGAFVVELHPDGWAFANFSGSPRYSAYAKASLAVGCTTFGSGFGSTADPPDVYEFSYLLGTDADNVPLAAGTDLGNGNLASGLAGGGTGLYNVYITWPASTNVDPSGCDIVVTSDGADIVLEGLDMNTGGTGAPGANDAWLLIAENVQLTAGNTYTVTQTANSDAYVSLRGHGVMWEAVPEPCTIGLLGLGLVFLRRRRSS
ncbi:MAG: PEP-CTERM sorting domain-containing protein [Phycisphaerales bacterium]|nr:MAG: PEP-CTERM sorting domain-containing protein [Phycisphaerales bacterium]